MAFGVVVIMHQIFDMPLRDAKRIARWVVIGGSLSDDEIVQRIDSLRLRGPESDDDLGD
ncbi:hypothetical protein [Actinoplanes sp. G11-F43]|uniref:hypothetical protein n=1 Tax=Actinoplanes sp. G11-F43 TaxID=3424130 RepID=UPI003D327085